MLKQLGGGIRRMKFGEGPERVHRVHPSSGLTSSGRRLDPGYIVGFV